MGDGRRSLRAISRTQAREPAPGLSWLLPVRSIILDMREVDSISLGELVILADVRLMDLVKTDVDLDLGRLLVDMDLHADGEQYLLETGSRHESLWGINLHPRDFGTPEFVEFDSVINLRPRQNRSRGVDDPEFRRRIRDLVMSKVQA
jgi:hypothetical protein